jgi:polyphosphate kinase
MEPVLHLLSEASSDPALISIKITLYRIDKTSGLAQMLINRRGKTARRHLVLELRARFDEWNNIEWAERFEESGCKVI